MRIALIAPEVTSSARSPSGQHNQRVISLAQVLARLGHRVTVYSQRGSVRRSSSVKMAPGLTVEQLPAGTGTRAPAGEVGAGIAAFSERLAQRWQHEQPDVAHAHSWTAGLAALAGGRELAVPVVQTFYSLGTRPLRLRAAVNGTAAPAEREGRPAVRGQQAASMRLRVGLARRSSGVLALSSQAMRQLTDLGVPRSAVRVVPWGVDTGQFCPEGPVARRTSRPRLLTVAPLSPDQGLDVVIRALADAPEPELVIAGTPARGRLADDRMCRALTRLAGELDVADRVRFTAAARPRDLPALMRSADLLVSAAWDEPFGAAALQAMACGTPVIASAVGCYEDAIIDGTTGMLVPPGRPGLLAHRIRSLLASPLRLEAFGIAATDRARARYSWDRIGQETAQAYEDCRTGVAA